MSVSNQWRIEMLPFLGFLVRGMPDVDPATIPSLHMSNVTHNIQKMLHAVTRLVNQTVYVYVMNRGSISHTSLYRGVHSCNAMHAWMNIYASE